MIEILGSMVYVTKDERQVVDQLFRLKPAAAIYYKQGRKIGYHWNLNAVTIARLKLTNK